MPTPRSNAAFGRFFFFNDTATTEIYTLSLHDALPILWSTPPWAVPPLSLRVTVTVALPEDRKSTRLNSSHLGISYAVFCLTKTKKTMPPTPSRHPPNPPLQTHPPSSTP